MPVTCAAPPDVCDHQLSAFLAAFRDGTLPREMWTHEAHLIVAWATLRELGDADATCSVLVEQIRAYNRCDTTAATVVDCHQTLTRYYVLAIDALQPSTLSDVLLARTCSRLAPLTPLVAEGVGIDGSTNRLGRTRPGSDRVARVVTIADTLHQASLTVAGLCPEPIGAALIVLRGPETGGGGMRRLARAKDLASRLRAANQFVLTPTHIRLFTLGGRTGLRAKEQIGAWPLGQVRIDARIEERSTYFASTGSSLDQHVFRLRLTGPGLDLTVDAMAYAGLDDLELDMLDAAALAGETDPDVAEGMAGLQEMSAETEQMVALFVQATGGAGWIAGPADGRSDR